MDLPDVTTEDFAVIVEWLYVSKRIEAIMPGPKLKVDEPQLHVYAETLLRLHIFADKYDLPVLRRESLDAMFSVYVHWLESPVPRQLSIACASLPDNSPALRMLIDTFACYSVGETMQVNLEGYLEELSKEVLVRIIARMAWFRDSHPAEIGEVAIDICHYHDHPDDAEMNECVLKRNRRKRMEEASQALGVSKRLRENHKKFGNLFLD